MKRKLLVEENDESGYNINRTLNSAGEGMRDGVSFCIKIFIILVIIFAIFLHCKC